MGMLAEKDAESAKMITLVDDNDGESYFRDLTVPPLVLG